MAARVRTRRPAPRRAPGATSRTRHTRPLVAELPDVRDGLTRTERLVLVTLAEVQAERGGRSVPTIELWGRLCERLDLTQDELQAILSRLVGRQSPP